MHPRVVKELASVIVDPFYFVFDLSLKTGRVPFAWKLGSICAIYKNKGSRNSVENYRPITLSSIACKILETIISHDVFNGKRNTYRKAIWIYERKINDFATIESCGQTE